MLLDQETTLSTVLRSLRKASRRRDHTGQRRRSVSAHDALRGLLRCEVFRVSGQRRQPCCRYERSVANEDRRLLVRRRVVPKDLHLFHGLQSRQGCGLAARGVTRRHRRSDNSNRRSVAGRERMVADSAHPYCRFVCGSAGFFRGLLAWL